VYLLPTGLSSPLGMTSIQLVQPIGAGPVRQWMDEHGEGLHHVCFAVDDLVAFTEAMRGEQDAHVFRGGRDRRACFLRGRLNGAIVELTETDPYPSYQVTRAEQAADGGTR
ncbi:MAG: VOC family protein, partial [Acidimicrobiales bacterium]